MAEAFTPITSQEQLDSVIGERLKRERETVSKKYADYEDLKGKVSGYETQIGELSKSLDDANKKISGFDQERQELNSRISAYETASVRTRIALEEGIPYELSGRLSGDTEDAIREDAKLLSQFISKNNTPPPLADTEGGKGGSTSGGDPYRKLLDKMKGE